MVYFPYPNDPPDPDLPNFEFDEDKSRMNREKHGIDFLEAQALWLDTRRVEVPACDKHEDRWLLVGRVGAQHWTAVITYRGEMVRLISVRRSRREEIERYGAE